MRYSIPRAGFSSLGRNCAMGWRGRAELAEEARAHFALQAAVRNPIPRADFFSLGWAELEAYVVQEPLSASGLFFSQKEYLLKR